VGRRGGGREATAHPFCRHVDFAPGRSSSRQKRRCRGPRPPGSRLAKIRKPAEAIEAVKHFLGVAGDGVTELRVMLEPGDMQHIE
jgi:hypothetical protein